MCPHHSYGLDQELYRFLGAAQVLGIPTAPNTPSTMKMWPRQYRCCKSPGEMKMAILRALAMVGSKHDCIDDDDSNGVDDSNGDDDDDRARVVPAAMEARFWVTPNGHFFCIAQSLPIATAHAISTITPELHAISIVVTSAASGETVRGGSDGGMCRICGNNRETRPQRTRPLSLSSGG